jgi:soluble lytic murein transglycosylase-like protein
MNALKSLLLIFCMFLMLIFGAIWGVSTERKMVKSAAGASLANTEDILTKWVYFKSEKISMDVSRLIAKEAIKTERPLLILAMISMESEFVPSATSSKRAVGLMQIMWEPHKKVLIEAGIAKERRDLYDICPSIRAGNFILNGFLSQSNGNVQKALELYLGGKDQAYTRRILGNLADLYILTGEKQWK